MPQPGPPHICIFQGICFVVLSIKQYNFIFKLELLRNLYAMIVFVFINNSHVFQFLSQNQIKKGNV